MVDESKPILDGVSRAFISEWMIKKEIQNSIFTEIKFSNNTESKESYGSNLVRKFSQDLSRMKKR